MNYKEFVGFKNAMGIKAFLEKEPLHPFHIHENTLELVCGINGSLDLADGAFDCTIQAGDIYIHDPLEPHCHVSHPGAMLLTVQIDRGCYKQYFPDIEDVYFICTPIGEKTRNAGHFIHMRFLMAKIYRTYLHDPYDGELERLGRQLLELAYRDFQYYMYRQNRQGRYEIVKQPIPLREGSRYRRIYDVVEKIKSHYKEKLTLAEVAAKAFVSQAHLSKGIKEATGLTFSQHISLLRCEEAERLLCHTNKTMDEIASEVGFANRSHLTAHFKKWYNKSPSKFRREIEQFNARIYETRKMTDRDRQTAARVIELFLDQTVI
ncbi:MAG: helix-turn-helix domain-containing protein [Anaerovoracaceae bacterium]